MNRIYVFLFILIAFLPMAFAGPIALPRLKIDPEQVTLSGFSSGAFFAVQMQVAYSKTFSGVGSVAGGIYWCSQGFVNQAQSICMFDPSLINVPTYVNRVLEEWKNGLVDFPGNIEKTKVYLYVSPADKVIKPQSTDRLKEFYLHWVPTSQVKLQNQISSAHGWPVSNYGEPCNQLGSPWIINCDFDMPGELLNHLYEGLKVPQKKAVSGNLFEFNQFEFGSASTPLYPTGFVYIPTSCQRKTSDACRLHVALHGCQMNPTYVEDIFAQESGLNRWAEENKIVVLYPQSDSVPLTNAFACWDWYGFTGANFANRKGPQMMAVKAMVDRLMNTKSTIQ